jgi:glutamine synthetase type III
MIGLSTANVAAAGNTTLTVTVVNQDGVLYTAAPVTVTFSSPCISNGQAVIAATGTSTAGTTPDAVTTSSGTVEATYTAKGCTGQDVITATAELNSDTLTAYGTVSVAG